MTDVNVQTKGVKMPAIAVLVKHVPDTWSEKSLEPDFTLQREGVDEVLDEVNEFAVEQGPTAERTARRFRGCRRHRGPRAVH